MEETTTRKKISSSMITERRHRPETVHPGIQSRSSTTKGWGGVGVEVDAAGTQRSSGWSHGSLSTHPTPSTLKIHLP